MIGRTVGNPSLPRPTVNLFSGGKHAGGQIAIQDVLIVPRRRDRSTMRLAHDHARSTRLRSRSAASKYGMRALVADEGGLAPRFRRRSTRRWSTRSTRSNGPGSEPGSDMALCRRRRLQPLLQRWTIPDRRSQLALQRGDDRWSLPTGLDTLSDRQRRGRSGRGGLGRLAEAPRRGCATGCWSSATIFCPPTRSASAARSTTKAANALLLKVNQIGTLTEAAEALRLARAAGWAVTVSARTGETEDDWLTDLAVGWGGRPDQGRLRDPLGAPRQVESPADRGRRNRLEPRPVAESRRKLISHSV